MKPVKFKNIVKLQAQKVAFKYLLDKLNNGKKGKLISYKQIELADYLTPECSLSVEDKLEMFSFRCEMNNLPNNFGKTDLCEMSCTEIMNNDHLLRCVHLNEGTPIDISLEQIRNGNISEKIEMLRILQYITRKRKEHINSKSY